MMFLWKLFTTALKHLSFIVVVIIIVISAVITQSSNEDSEHHIYEFQGNEYEIVFNFSKANRCSLLLSGEIKLKLLRQKDCMWRSTNNKVRKIFGLDFQSVCPKLTELNKQVKECRKVDWIFEQKRFRKIVKHMQNEFPSQRKALWINIVSAVNSILVNEPVQPSVLLFLHKGNAAVSLCIAKRIALNVAKIMNDTISHPFTLDADVNFKDSMEDLFQRVHLYFEGGHYTLIVDNFQRIPGEKAMLFHSLCDNFYAPFRRAVYILILNCDQLWDGDLIWEDGPDRISEIILEKLWERALKKDTYSSIISRVTNNVVIILKEESLQSC